MEFPALDPILVPVVASDDDRAEDCISVVIRDHTDPLVRRVVSRQLRGSRVPDHHLEDVVATVVARLAERLISLRADGGAEPVERWSDYVAAAAHNGCHELLRRLAPRRSRLAARLRYLARRGVGISMEVGADGRWWCRPAPHPLTQRGATKALLRALQSELSATRPTPFAEVVDRVAVRLGEVDPPAPLALDQLRSLAPDPEERATDGELLRRLWDEIVKLPRRQRVALLLNLRDPEGGEITNLFTQTGIANPTRIAAALDMPLPETERLLQALPRDDLWIAELLGITRRQVINLRKAARARLSRRTAGWR